MASFNIMEPIEIENDELSSEQKSRAKVVVDNHVNNIELQLGRTATFEDLIEDRIKRTTFNATHQRYNAYKKIWELSGRDISQADLVYSKYFKAGIAITNKEVLKENDDLENYGRNIVDYKSSKSNYRKVEDNSKMFDPFSSKGALYLGIGVFLLCIIYPIINYYSFLVLGAIALLLLMYFQDKLNK